MKKLIQFAIYCIVVLFFSCQKDVSIPSTQKVELSFYTYEGSSTPVKINWSSQTTGFCEKSFTTICTEKFYINQGDTLRIKIIPEKENSFLNVYFKLDINDVTVRTARLYNDTDTNTETIALVYYRRNFENYSVCFTHNTNDENDGFPYQLCYCANDSTFRSLALYTCTAEPGDMVSSKISFKIPSSNPVKSVFHKTTIMLNGEIIRYDFIQREGCGSHCSEISALIEPYL